MQTRAGANKETLEICAIGSSCQKWVANTRIPPIDLKSDMEYLQQAAVASTHWVCWGLNVSVMPKGATVLSRCVGSSISVCGLNLPLGVDSTPAWASNSSTADTLSPPEQVAILGLILAGALHAG